MYGHGESVTARNYNYTLRFNSSNEPRPRRRFHSSASASEWASHATLFDSPCPLQTATAPETYVSGAGRFVRARGIELRYSAWKADVLPLNYARVVGDSSMKLEVIPVVKTLLELVFVYKTSYILGNESSGH